MKESVAFFPRVKVDWMHSLFTRTFNQSKNSIIYFRFLSIIYGNIYTLQDDMLSATKSDSTEIAIHTSQTSVCDN